MNRDPRVALSQELEAKQTLLDQLCALAADDPDFLTDLLEGETTLLELIAALDASIVDDETFVDGDKAALDKLQARKRAAENRIELKRRLLRQGIERHRRPKGRGARQVGMPDRLSSARAFTWCQLVSLLSVSRRSRS